MPLSTSELTIQTFLPYADYTRSAKTLDNKRLGKQRVETFQVIQALSGRKIEGTKLPHPNQSAQPGKFIDAPQSDWYTIEYTPTGWTNHPVAHMWRGYLASLLEYQEAVCHEWVAVRGYRDTCLAKARLVLAESSEPSDPIKPYWFGDEPLHRSHRANLVNKLGEHYASQFSDIERDGITSMPYLWPEPPAFRGSDHSLRITKADLPLVIAGMRKLPSDLTLDVNTGRVRAAS